MPTEEGWVSVQEAARASGVATRTLYSWLKSKRLTSRKIAGMQHVTLADVHAAAARLQTPAGAAVHAVQQSATSATSQVLLRAQDDLEVARVETEQLKAQAAALKAKDELALADAERDKRRQLYEIELERQRIALRREEAEYERSLAEAAARQAAEHRRQVAEAEHAGVKRERELAARSAEQRREHWLRAWLESATDWVISEGLPELAGPLLAVVREALRGLGPDDPPNVVKDAIYHSTVREFASEFAIHGESVLRESRAHAAQAASQVASRECAAVQQAVYAAARAAADEVDPQTVTGWNLIEEAARLELQRLRDEARAAGWREAEQQRRQERAAQQARQDAERVAEQLRRQDEEKRKKERIARAWVEVEREIPALARSALPVGCSEEEVAGAEAEIQRALAENRDTTTPAAFIRGVECLLGSAARQVRDRQRAEAEDELWQQTFSRGLAELNRQLPSGATRAELEAASEAVTMSLSALREGSSPAGAQSAISSIIEKALLPCQRRLAVERALGRVPPSAGDALAIAAVRAAARAVDGRREAWELESLAMDAMRREIDRAQRQ